MVRDHVANLATIHADEGSGWADLHAGWDTRRTNRNVAILDEGVCTNQAESFFSRLRRAETGVHHHIAGPHLSSYAGEDGMAGGSPPRRQRLTDGEDRRGGHGVPGEPSLSRVLASGRLERRLAPLSPLSSLTDNAFRQRVWFVNRPHASLSPVSPPLPLRHAARPVCCLPHRDNSGRSRALSAVLGGRTMVSA